jgi:3-phosphoshikimate 1-carboxyvinyltransferase
VLYLASSISLAPYGDLRGKVIVPPSKSYTHRAVISASLSSGQSRVHNPLISRDTTATLEACRSMGASIEESAETLTIIGSRPHAAGDIVNVENSGTTLRFMTSVFCLPEHGCTVLTGDASIRRRPMQGLIDALSKLGAKARSSQGNGCAPIIVGEGGMEGGDAEIRGDVSSQFVSSILLSAPLAKGDTSLRVTGAVSRPYIEATLHLLRQHRINIDRQGTTFRIPGSQEYHREDFQVPGDFGSAAFFMAAVALIGGELEFSGLTSTLPQGDSPIVDILQRLGAKVNANADSIKVRADGEALVGGTFDLGDSPDLLPILSVLSLKCLGPLEIRGVAHARFKESDRISVAAEGLRMMGATVDERPDGLRILKPESITPAVLDAQNDHRMFMSFAVASMLLPGSIRVTGAESLDVSYPGFLKDMERVGIRVMRA